jgi:hypothetical protein
MSESFNSVFCNPSEIFLLDIFLFSDGILGGFCELGIDLSEPKVGGLSSGFRFGNCNFSNSLFGFGSFDVSLSVLFVCLGCLSSEDSCVGVNAIEGPGVCQEVLSLSSVESPGGFGRLDFLLDLVGVDDFGKVGVGDKGSQESVA